MKRGALTFAVLLAVSPFDPAVVAAQSDTAAVATVRVKQRSTRQGAKIGALVGAPAGALFGAFVVLLLDAYCEVDCDFNAVEATLVTAGFGALGALGGGAAGAIIGAAIPRRVDARSPAESPPHFGIATLEPAFARAAGARGAIGARASFAFQTTHAAVGFEAGKYGQGVSSSEAVLFCNDRPQPCADTLRFESSVFHAGAVARAGMGAHRAIEPYASAGVGVYSWGSARFGSTQVMGYALGVGVHARSRASRRGVHAEVRRHSNLTGSGDPRRAESFISFALGGSLSW